MNGPINGSMGGWYSGMSSGFWGICMLIVAVVIVAVLVLLFRRK